MTLFDALSDRYPGADVGEGCGYGDEVAVAADSAGPGAGALHPATVTAAARQNAPAAIPEHALDVSRTVAPLVRRRPPPAVAAEVALSVRFVTARHPEVERTARPGGRRGRPSPEAADYAAPVPMTARYATTCGVCASPVQPGEEIARSGERWAHAACAGGADVGSASPGRGKSTASGTGTKSSTGTGSRPARAKAKAPRPDMPAPEGALEVWTDGACSGNPGPGGWAWATRDGQQGADGEPDTTNQRMEIRAALEAVRALEGPLVVVSDSTYVVNCFRDGWWKGWLARGWVTSAKKPVVSRDLWEPLITLVNDRGDVSFRWTKGHSGDEMNDLVDRLAVEQSKIVSAS